MYSSQSSPICRFVLAALRRPPPPASVAGGLKMYLISMRPVRWSDLSIIFFASHPPHSLGRYPLPRLLLQGGWDVLDFNEAIYRSYLCPICRFIWAAPRRFFVLASVTGGSWCIWVYLSQLNWVVCRSYLSPNFRFVLAALRRPPPPDSVEKGFKI